MKKLFLLFLFCYSTCYAGDVWIDGQSNDGHIIQVNGTTLRQDPILDFVGSVGGSTSGSKTVINITGGSFTYSDYFNQSLNTTDKVNFTGITLIDPYPIIYMRGTYGTGGGASINFQGTGETNLWRIGESIAVSESGNLEFVEGSTARMYFKPGGNVGIGMTNPAKLLDIAGAINATDAAFASGNVTGNWNVTNVYATNNKHGFTYTISNGTSVLTTGWAGYMPVMNNFTLTKSIISSTDFTAGSCTIQVKKAPPLAAGAFNLTEANNFTLCGNFTIGASNTTFVDATLTGWNTTWVTDEYIGFNITAVSGFKGVVLQGKSTN